MTRDEMDKEIGGAFAEREELARKIKCLRFRLRTYGSAFVTLADSPFEDDMRKIADQAPDLSVDWKDLKKALERTDELSKLLDLGEAR